jgi:hypothetical protein
MGAPIERMTPPGADASWPGKGQPAAAAGLVRLWRQWLAIVEMFARFERARRRVDPHEYQSLQRRLVDTCRALARVPGLPNGGVYDRMERLVSPWLTLGALEQADGEILNDLLTLGRQLDRQLGGGRWWPGIRRGAVRALVVALIAAGSLLAVRRTDRFLSPLLNWGKGKWLEVRWAFTRSDSSLWWFLGAALVTLLAIYLVSRTARG